jgi:hypothetical protein
MSQDVDAVIAALRVVLREAETRTRTLSWETHTVNKWIGQLPGAWLGRCRHLKLKATYKYNNEASREDLITHVRAMLAYLETNRETIAAQRSWWPFGRRALGSPHKSAIAAVKEEPVRVEKREEPPTVQAGTTKPKWLN